MKQLKLIFPFVWYSAAIVIITCTLMCIDYSVGEASAIAVIFLPGILIARYATPQLSFADRWQGCCNTIFLWAGILAIEYFLIMLANYYILNPRNYGSSLSAAIINNKSALYPVCGGRLLHHRPPY